VSGSDLVVNKNKEKGIGTHANSVIEFDIPEGYTHFKALVGVDNAAAMQNVGATMQFMVFTEDPAGPVVPEKSAISIDLKALGFTGKCQIVDLWSGKKWVFLQVLFLLKLTDMEQGCTKLFLSNNLDFNL
jgi:hypothetical protein